MALHCEPMSQKIGLIGGLLDFPARFPEQNLVAQGRFGIPKSGHELAGLKRDPLQDYERSQSSMALRPSLVRRGSRP